MNVGVLTLPAPAKINHFLHITGQRVDGYHELQTLFQFLAYSDSLRFELRQDNRIVIEPANMLGIRLQENLIYRAAFALQQLASSPKGVTISVDKKIPMGAGLGGGSSNAATTLFALNWLWELNITNEQLMEYGVRLGADVPVFLYGHAAWAEGIGDQLTPSSPPEDWVVVVIPPCSVATAQMYADPDLTRNTPPLKIGTLDELRNDFEPLVRQRYPEVDEAFKWLSDYGKARLSGSGASVFTCVASVQEAAAIVHSLPPRFKGFFAQGINRSPLMQEAVSLGFRDIDWGVAKR